MSDKPQEYDGKCHARSRRTGEPCKKKPRKWFVVCDFHGGNLPKVREAARRRQAEYEAWVETRARLAELGWYDA